jgi:hypothetical protein
VEARGVEPLFPSKIHAKKRQCLRSLINTRFWSLANISVVKCVFPFMFPF